MKQILNNIFSKKLLLFLFLTLFGIVGVSAVTDEDLGGNQK